MVLGLTSRRRPRHNPSPFLQACGLFNSLHPSIAQRLSTGTRQLHSSIHPHSEMPRLRAGVGAGSRHATGAGTHARAGAYATPLTHPRHGQPPSLSRLLTSGRTWPSLSVPIHKSCVLWDSASARRDMRTAPVSLLSGTSFGILTRISRTPTPPKKTTIDRPACEKYTAGEVGVNAVIRFAMTSLCHGVGEDPARPVLAGGGWSGVERGGAAAHAVCTAWLFLRPTLPSGMPNAMRVPVRSCACRMPAWVAQTPDIGAGGVGGGCFPGPAVPQPAPSEPRHPCATQGVRLADAQLLEALHLQPNEALVRFA